MLGLVVLAVAGLWYRQEGRDVVQALFFRRSARTNAQPDGLPALYLEIEPEAYRRMYEQWQAAPRKGITPLDERDWVRGRIRFRIKSVPASLWLKQVAVEHWQENKWAWQMRLDENETLLGMRAFSAQSPAVRRSLDEWLYTQALRDAEILAPRTVFAHVWVNGDDWGIYALQEGIAESFFVSQGRTRGVVLRIDDSLFGRQRAWLDGTSPGSERTMPPMDARPGFALVDEWNAAEVERDLALQEQSVAALGLLRAFQRGQLAPSQVFDTEQVGRYIAHALLWGARYGAQFEGERYYYDPLTAWLAPLGGDALPLQPAYAHFPSLAQYQDLEVMEAYVREALRISHPAYLESVRATYEGAFKRYRTALEREFPPSALAEPWPLLSERQAILDSSLHPPQTVRATCVPGETDAAFDLRVGNLGSGAHTRSCGRAARRLDRPGGRNAHTSRCWTWDRSTAQVRNHAALRGLEDSPVRMAGSLPTRQRRVRGHDPTRDAHRRDDRADRGHCRDGQDRYALLLAPAPPPLCRRGAGAPSVPGPERAPGVPGVAGRRLGGHGRSRPA
jgi:hypothetical protein